MATAGVDLPLGLVLALDLLTARLSRAGDPALIVSADAGLRAAAREWFVGVQSVASAVSAPSAGARRVAWLMPTADDGGVPELVTPAGVIGIVRPGRLAGVFARLRRGTAPESAPPTRLQGFDTELRCGIGGLASPVWASLSRLADRAGRPDLVDRFELRYRRSLAPVEGAAPSELVVLVARRARQQA